MKGETAEIGADLVHVECESLVLSHQLSKPPSPVTRSPSVKTQECVFFSFSPKERGGV
jgi:hypothetical protein